MNIVLYEKGIFADVIKDFFKNTDPQILGIIWEFFILLPLLLSAEITGESYHAWLHVLF